MNKIPISSLTLLFALILPLFANAQVTVKGIVTDESGVPLVGVSVRYKEVPKLVLPQILMVSFPSRK
ncbi:hypothetical protein SFC43_20985 [Bacteroides sp. CR5/BHMF/2]|nr:hypothetical protein [Bacteroides sp. CR5/BHMF/2]